MLEELIKLDKELFLYLNGLGTPSWDAFWLYLSHTLSAITIPIFVLVVFLSYRVFGLKKMVSILVMTVVLISSTELGSILFKNNVARLRPCYNTEIIEMMRLVKGYCGGQFGYFSAHAANSWAFASFFGLLFREKSKFFVLFLVVWAFLVSYSRIYIGVHFPLDVITGFLFGIFFGCLYGYLFSKLSNKYL